MSELSKLKICVILVNYNKSEITLMAIKSIYSAFMESVNMDLIIVDNNSLNTEKSILLEGCDKRVKIIWSNLNLGYFGGINFGLSHCDKLQYDYIVIGNNDVVFDFDFFEKLAKARYAINTYAISPNIVSADGYAQNPHEYQVVPNYRKILYTLYYCNYYFGFVLFRLQQFRKKVFKIKNRVKESDVPMEIHLGYGALYVLTKNFMSKIDELDYPCFLMGEEYFLAWQIKQTGGIIYYDPSLVVFHHEHASVNTMPAKLLYKYSKESFLKFRKFWSKF